MKRFWNKVNKLGPDKCHEWTASTNRNGYGQFKWFDHGNGKQKVIEAHRVAWFLEKGEWPNYLCHTCDNSICVNTLHLYEGTHQSNMNDKYDHNRANHYTYYDDTLVVQMRVEYANGVSSDKLSVLHNIPKTTILSILNGKIRKDAGGPIRDRAVRYWTNRYSTGKTGGQK